MTKNSPHSSYLAATRDGVALVIILGFLVLLSGLTLAFFSRAILERQVSNSSAAQNKADLLARSAAEVIVGDLKTEMVLGSVAKPPQFADGSYLYTPQSNQYMEPLRFGTPSPSGVPADSIPNLVRRSVRGDTASGPAAVSGTTTPPFVPSRASAVNSTTDLSANGRAVSLARWNSHYLIPRQSTSTTIDSTPISAFTPPDWVMVTSSGPEVITAPSSKVIGRYAYAIYNEGGLLDVNAAGFPVPTSTPTSSPYPRYKGTVAFADLEQLPYFSSSSSSAYANIVNNIVGWRNYASAQPGSTLTSNYSFDDTAAARYYNYIFPLDRNQNEIPKPSPALVGPNFLTANPSPSPSPVTAASRTDQAFTSREALLKFRRATGMSQNVLQYLGTFSRDLDQPSYFPSANLPPVQSGPTTNGTYGTGNDAYPPDQNNPINPAFLKIRVQVPFPRADGSMAVVGEPLVKQRFPLSRLDLLGVANPTSAQLALITTYFGLTRTGPEQWSYNHGTAGKIHTLTDVQGFNREPDFFELLKAAINVGSLGKGACPLYNGISSEGTGVAADWNDGSGAAFEAQKNDTVVDLQLFQIGANIIDQYDADSVPTQIYVDSTHTVSGIEDLPYIYRVRDRAVQTSVGTGCLLLVPTLWNPHSQIAKPSTAAPTHFRFGVVPHFIGGIPAGPATLQINYAESTQNTKVSDYIATFTAKWPLSSTSPPECPSPLTFDVGTSTGNNFREPIMLAEANKPAGTNLGGGTLTPETYPGGATLTGATIQVTPGRSLVGCAPTFSGASVFPWYPPQESPTLRHWAYQADYTSSPLVDCYLECQDPSSGRWVQYDKQTLQWNQATQFNWNTDTAGRAVWDITDADINTGLKYQNKENLMMGATRFDPRMSRWGLYHSAYVNDIHPSTPGTSSYVYPSVRPYNATSWGSHIGNLADKGFVNAFAQYVNNAQYYPDRGYRGVAPGYWEENSVRVMPLNNVTADSTTEGTHFTQATDSAKAHYNRDPDGIVRRAMGGYASDTVQGGATTAGTNVGLPLVPSDSYGIQESRPVVLNRPFRSVAELGYVCRGTPWGNLNMTFPESGDVALLDVFCINETQNTSGIVAGRVDVNTRQPAVLQALIANALTEDEKGTSIPNSATIPTLSVGSKPPGTVDTPPGQVARLLYNLTTSTDQNKGPLTNRSELIGRPLPSLSVSNVDPDVGFTGFAHDIGITPIPTEGSPLNSQLHGQPAALIPRLRLAAMRALGDSTTPRVWNLMVDIVAQSGHYPTNNTVSTPQAKLANFVIDGERRYWLHVAIDRYTGQVLDAQYEPVSE